MNRDVRFSELLNLTNKSNVTVDVGCDHGYITLGLLEQNIAKRVIATDISQQCLEKTINLINQNNYQNRVDFIVTDGLNDIENPSIDQIIIAGMGGKTIMQILDNMPNCCKNARLILQPMSKVSDVRLKLNSLGYKIERDLIIYQGDKFYHMMTATNGTQILDECQILCGVNKSDYQTKDYQIWLNYKINELNDAIIKISSIDKRNKMQQIKTIYETALIKENKKC